MIQEFIVQYWHNLLIVVSVFTVGVASPGPATLMILSVAVSQGRRQAIALSLGIITGSLAWAAVAALGFIAAMSMSVTLFVVLKFAGALYLLYLAVRSIRSALLPLADAGLQRAPDTTLHHSFFKGLLLHLTNPKAPLVWMATLSVGAEATVNPYFFVVAIGLCSLIAFSIFMGYAFIFSTAVASRSYLTLRRPFDLVIGALFGAAAIRMLTLRST